MSTMFVELFTDFGTVGHHFHNPLFRVRILYANTDNNLVPETQDDAEKSFLQAILIREASMIYTDQFVAGFLGRILVLPTEAYFLL